MIALTAVAIRRANGMPSFTAHTRALRPKYRDSRESREQNCGCS